jgi:hypothetical protein
MKQLYSVQPDASLRRAGQMVQLHKAQSVPTIGPSREENTRKYSILRRDMPHREDAAPDANHGLVSISALRLLRSLLTLLNCAHAIANRLTLIICTLALNTLANGSLRMSIS